MLLLLMRIPIAVIFNVFLIPIIIFILLHACVLVILGPRRCFRLGRLQSCLNCL